MVEDEIRFGNVPAVMFVNVKGMKEVVRKGAVCLDNTFVGGGCLQGPVALTHQPNCPLCSFSFEIVGDVGCSCEIVKSCVRCRGHGASHILESHSLDSFQSFCVDFVHDVAMQTVGLAMIYFSIMEIILALITLIG